MSTKRRAYATTGAAITLAGVVVVSAVVCDRRDLDDHRAEPEAEEQRAAPGGEELTDEEAERLERKHETVRNLEPGQRAQFGEDIAAGDPVAPTGALEGCAEASEPCLLKGVVNQVCDDRACWLTLDGTGGAPDETPDTARRVRLLDHEVVLPRNIVGAEAVVWGAVADREIDEAEMRRRAVERAQAQRTAGSRHLQGSVDHEMKVRAIEVRAPE